MKNLQEVLQQLSEKKIEGVNSFARVNREMQDVSEFMSIVKIVDNNRFSLEYNHKTQQVELKTTYSNQVVDSCFIEEMTSLNQAKELLNEQL